MRCWSFIGRYSSSQDKDEKFIFVCTFMDVIGFIRGTNQLGSEQEIFSALTSNKESMGLNNLDRFCEFCDVGVTCSPLPSPHSLDMLLSHCCCHFSRHQTNPAACQEEQVIMALVLHSPPDSYIDVGTVGSVKMCHHTPC